MFPVIILIFPTTVPNQEKYSFTAEKTPVGVFKSIELPLTTLMNVITINKRKIIRNVHKNLLLKSVNLTNKTIITIAISNNIQINIKV